MTRKKENPILEYARRMARILYAIEYLGRYCAFCNFDGFSAPWLMEFHHRDEKTKKYEVKNKLYGGAFNSHKEELDKCILTCVSCHRTHHANAEKYQQHLDIIFDKLEEIRKNGTGKITKNHFLTDEEMNNIFQLVNEGFIMTEISEKLKLRYDTVKTFIRRHKLNPKKRSRIKISWSMVAKMLNAKHSLRNIAEKLNINRETLRSHLEEYIECEILSNGIKRYRLK